MADVVGSEPSESQQCISCGHRIIVDEASRTLHGFPIHVACYERELGLSKERGEKREPDTPTDQDSKRRGSPRRSA